MYRAAKKSRKARSKLLQHQQHQHSRQQPLQQHLAGHQVDLGAAAKKLGDGMMILALARETQRIKELGHGKDEEEDELLLLQDQQQQMLTCL